MKPSLNNKYRKIIHIDMDAFFASIEQLDFPQYRGKPIAVGGNNKRGVVAAASYEARKFGVHSAMSSVIAKRKCPQLIFAKPRFQRYKEVSLEIYKILKEFTNLVEAVSIDEAYLDVTENLVGIPSATIIAKKIKQRIKTKTNLTASAGVSYNKFLAKIASDYNKPNGLYVILPTEAIKFIEKLPIEKFHGIGKATTKKMHNLGIYTGADLKKSKKTELQILFGKYGLYYYNIVRGIDTRKIVTKHIRKSLSTEKTFRNDISNHNEIEKALWGMVEELFLRIKKKNVTGKTLTLKIKYYDFEIITRSQTLDNDFNTKDKIFDSAKKLLKKTNSHKPIRLLGLGVSNFYKKKSNNKSNKQLKLNF